MLGVLDKTDGMVHFTFPCPACERPVHVVANPAQHDCRWCCLACSVVGRAPLALGPEILEPDPLPAAASA